MNLAIMQPYLFPYLGYFQLIHAVDKLVIYDDVSFIKNGWINRNRVLVDGQPHYFTVPLQGASPFAPIREVRFQDAAGTWKTKMLRMFEQAYARAPFREVGMGLLADVLDARSDRVSDLASRSIAAVLAACGLPRTIVPSSTGYGNAELAGEARVLDICAREGATTYVNAPGGRGLYSGDNFRSRGIRLQFLRPRLDPYPQQRAPQFVAGLSVLDALMNCGPQRVGEMIGQYDLEDE